VYFGLKFSSGNFGRTVGWSRVEWPQVGKQLWYASCFTFWYITLHCQSVKLSFFTNSLQSATLLSETPILLVLPTGYCGLAGMILVNTSGTVTTTDGVFIYLLILFYLFIYSFIHSRSHDDVNNSDW